jgi:hypothetical protein
LLQYGLSIDSSGNVYGSPIKSASNASLNINITDSDNNSVQITLTLSIINFTVKTTNVSGRIGQLITPISVQTIGGVAPFVFSCAALTEIRFSNQFINWRDYGNTNYIW